MSLAVVPPRFHAPESIGPPCPACGCGETLIVSIPKVVETLCRGERGLAWTAGVAHCQNCESVFEYRPTESPDEIDEVEYAKTIPYGISTKRVARRCPYCGSVRTDVVTTRRPNESGTRIRYHKCLACWGGFKSIEAKPERSGS